MPVKRPREFSVTYQFCRAPPMKGIHCREGEIVGGSARYAIARAVPNPPPLGSPA